MVRGIRTGYPRGLNKGLGLKLQEGSRVRKEDSRIQDSSRVQQEIPEESRRLHRPKRCTDNNKDEDNSPNNTDNTISDFVLIQDPGG